MKRKYKEYVIITTVLIYLTGFAVWGILKKDNDISFYERRRLAGYPDIKLSSMINGKWMEDTERYLLDQFPLRQGFRELKAITMYSVFRQKDNNGIYMADGSLSKLDYVLDEKSLQYATDRFRYLFRTCLQGKADNIYVSIIPDKNYYMAEKNGYPTLDYKLLIDKVTGQMDYAAYIDITDLLELNDYYRTDIHWRQEKIKDVAEKIASEMGKKITEDYINKKSDIPFYGVYYGQNSLPVEADTLYYVYHELFEQCSIYDYETDAYVPMYHIENEYADLYDLFLHGAKSLLTIKNPQAKSDETLVVFRDSFGSSIMPYFAEIYSEIIMADIRYLAPDVLQYYLKGSDFDVLFLYSTTLLNNSKTLR